MGNQLNPCRLRQLRQILRIPIDRLPRRAIVANGVGCKLGLNKPRLRISP